MPKSRAKGLEDIVLGVNKEIKETKTKAEAYTKAVFKVLEDLILAHGAVRTPIGTFKVKEWRERIVKNNITGGKTVYIPKRRVLTFSASERMKKLLNEKTQKEEQKK